MSGTGTETENKETKPDIKETKPDIKEDKEVTCGLCWGSGMGTQEIACMRCAGKGLAPVRVFPHM